ncbi:putative cell wall-binding protein [Clostridium beijerinckii]|nr:putative cell wall-binding protein [Clostridium beijerinckii]
MEELKKAIKEIIEDNVIKLVISNKTNKNFEYNKIVINLKENNKRTYYQIEKYTDKQVFHENIDTDILEERIIEYVEPNYKQISAWSNSASFEVKISKKGKVLLSKKKK